MPSILSDTGSQASLWHVHDACLSYFAALQLSELHKWPRRKQLTGNWSAALCPMCGTDKLQGCFCCGSNKGSHLTLIQHTHTKIDWYTPESLYSIWSYHVSDCNMSNKHIIKISSVIVRHFCLFLPTSSALCIMRRPQLICCLGSEVRSFVHSAEVKVSHVYHFTNQSLETDMKYWCDVEILTDGRCSTWWNSEQQLVSDKDRDLAPVDRWPTMLYHPARLGYTWLRGKPSLYHAAKVYKAPSPLQWCVYATEELTSNMSADNCCIPKTLDEWNPGHASWFYFLPLSRPELQPNL